MTMFVMAALFLYFLMKTMPMKKIRVPVKRPRRFWIHGTLHRRKVINEFVSIRLPMAIVGDVFLCTLEDRTNQDIFVALVVSSFSAGFWFVNGRIRKEMVENGCKCFPIFDIFNSV